MKSDPGQIIGHNIIYLESVTSTNDYFKTLDTEKIDDGTVVIAENQTHGRGRNGKKWISSTGKGLTFSVLLRPKIFSSQTLIFSYIPVITLTRFFIRHLNISAGIKWPNDIYVNHKKIAGILYESASYKNSLKYFITGIGININQNIDDFNDLKSSATSVAILLKKSVDKELFLFKFLKEFDNDYRRFNNSADWEDDVVNDWNSLCQHMNSRVQIMDEKNIKFFGIFKGINRNGAALIKTDRNIIKTVNIDHFSLRENYVISD
ncbi:biotin--[acetyl-CoA-carboxylase] ligase [candidate division KSB1 bacterium]|nr:biotin--[acetyl-CoA-carboxylase] ligase [candidate division KSB1 bacterium]